MEDNSNEITKTKLCLHCKENQRKPIKNSNFSRHMKDMHNNIYQSKKKQGHKRSSGYEYLVDYDLGPSTKRIKLEEIGEKSDEQERIIIDKQENAIEDLDQSFIIDNQDKSIAKSEFQIMARKRDLKQQQKIKKENVQKITNKVPRQSISISTDLHSQMNTRLQLVEQEQQSIKNKLEKIEETQREQQILITKILAIITQEENLKSKNIKQYQNNPLVSNNQENNINEEQININTSGVDIQKSDDKVQKVPQEENKQCNEKNISSIKVPLKDSEWQTWIDIKSNKSQPLICGKNFYTYKSLYIDYKGCKTQGDRRLYFNKDGIKFEKIVKTLIKILKYEPENPGYSEEVAKQLIGVELQQGFQIKQVLGAGSVGTTVLAYDQQELKNIALKIYHVAYSITSGLREYKMLHLSSFAPSIVKVNSLMYNTNGSFLAISMEDLSQYSTVYNFVQQQEISEDKKLLIVRNIARAVTELHSIKIVHGDIATENILANVENQDIKIIDFDISAKEGEKIKASGNPDFITREIQECIESKSFIKASMKNDIYALGLICFLILGDNEKTFFTSLSQEPLSTQQKEKLIEKEKFIGKNIVKKLITRKISAEEAALSFNTLYEKYENV